MWPSDYQVCDLVTWRRECSSQKWGSFAFSSHQQVTTYLLIQMHIVHTQHFIFISTPHVSIETGHNRAMSTKYLCEISQILQNMCYNNTVVFGSTSRKQLIVSITVMCFRFLRILIPRKMVESWRLNKFVIGISPYVGSSN